MRRKLSFIIGSTLVAGVLAVALRTLPENVPSSIAKVLPAPVLRWIDAPSEADASEPVLPEDGSPVEYVIGPQKSGLQEIRVWAIRNGTKYGWIQLPKGTPVRLLREEGSWLVVRYDESVMKIHRSVAEMGMVVPVTRSGRVASL
jgi:hypothetical protein